MSCPETLACVSVRQPWASLCAWGIKPVENRTWHCAHRGPIVIHASKTWTKTEEADYNDLLSIAIRIGDKRRQEILSLSRNMRGGLVGICIMTGCVHEDVWFGDGNRGYDGENEWFCGPYGWLWRHARPLSWMVPYKGQQGLFRIPSSAIPEPDYKEIIRYVQ